MSTPAPSQTPSAWQHGSHGSSLEPSASNVCFSNLIVFTEDPEEEAKTSEAISDFVGKHPCRAIVILARPKDKESKLEASVITHAASPKGNKKQVTCDQITIKASGAAVKEIPGAVQPLLVSDLPVHLWWKGNFLTHKTMIEQMLPYCSRFIYDGVSWTDLHYTVPQVSDFIEHHKDTVGFTNFNWSKLRPWREFAADFFDYGQMEKDVWNLNRVRIEYMSLPGMEEGFHFRALLLVSWFASQLEWEPVQGKSENDQDLLLFKNRKGSPVVVEMAQIPQDNPSGQSIQRLNMAIRRGEVLEEFTVHRDHKLHLMVLTHKKGDTSHIIRKVPHLDTSTADILNRELGRRIRNRVFERAFTLAAKLMTMLQS